MAGIYSYWPISQIINNVIWFFCHGKAAYNVVKVQCYCENLKGRNLMVILGETALKIQIIIAIVITVFFFFYYQNLVHRGFFHVLMEPNR